jgi:hypothetical protein
MNFDTSPLIKPGLVAASFTDIPSAGKRLVNLSSVGMFPAMAGSTGPLGGYHTGADVNYPLADGTDVDALWAEFQASLQIYNIRQAAIIAALTFPVTQLIETVPTGGEVAFERASEFGVPKSARVENSYFQMAYDFEDYDLALRYTWKFLRDADQRRVEAVHQAALRADQLLIFNQVMATLFDNRNRVADIRNQNYNVYALYNADGTVPPAYKTTTFDGTHSHYLVSGAATFNALDLEDATAHIAHHGFNRENGTQIVHVMNSAQTAVARQFRAGQTTNGVVSNFDFIPASNQPAMYVPNAEGLLGSRPPTTWRGLPVVGSYMDAWIVEEDYIPANYILTLGTGGTAALQNPVGLREHPNPAYRGLRLLPGNQQRYPLVDSYYARAFGTGIRQRGSAVITQIKASGTYDRPAGFDRDNLV